ncbi:MAG TPA: hypothetical protein VHN99_05800, partial [Deinococcales bacterium]|nr:hypothetical protein [Deinococcales bacterium]
DPRTGLPANARFVQATAVAERVTQAEVLTKLAILGAVEPLRRLGGNASLLAWDERGRAFEWTGAAWEPTDPHAMEGSAA